MEKEKGIKGDECTTTFDGSIKHTYDEEGELWLTIGRRESTQFVQEETVVYDHKNFITRTFDENNRIKFKQDTQQKFIISNENLFPSSNEVVIIKNKPYRPLTFLYRVEEIDDIAHFQISSKYSGVLDGDLSNWANIATEISLNRGLDHFAICIEKHSKILEVKIINNEIEIVYLPEHLTEKYNELKEELNNILYPNYDCFRALK